MAAPEYDIMARQERYREAHNNGDMAKLNELWSDNLDYSDYGLGLLHITKTEIMALAREIAASVKDLCYETVSVNGTKKFTAWEWVVTGVLIKELPGLQFVVGESISIAGCSLFWWDVDGEGGAEAVRKLSEYPEFKK